MCKRCGMLQLQSRDKNKRGMIINARCGTWKCPECGKDLREGWQADGEVFFTTCPMWEYAVCSKSQFEALVRRVRSQGKLYTRIRFENGLHHVFHHPLVANRKYKPDCTQWINASAAFILFKEILWRPNVARLSCSVVLQKKKAKKPPSQWERIAYRSGSTEQVNSFLKSLGIEERVVSGISFSPKLLDVILLRDFPVFKRSNVLSYPIGEKGMGSGENEADGILERFECKMASYEVSVTDEIDFSMLR